MIVPKKNKKNKSESNPEVDETESELTQIQKYIIIYILKKKKNDAKFLVHVDMWTK